MSLYYTVASLPGLPFGDPPPFSADELAERCEGVLPPADQASLRAVVRGEPETAADPFAAAWLRADTQLRNAVAAARGERQRVDAGSYLREHTGFDVSIENAVADAFGKSDPLERERELDRCRWRLLDELTREEPFGPGALLAYAIRLRIAQRWAGRKEDTGRARLDEHLDHYIGESGLRAAAG